MGRLRDIVTILTKHGFYEFISLDIIKKIPNLVLPKSKRPIAQELAKTKDKDKGQLLGQRLKQCFEELGPAFVKFGQFLSTREDIFDESFTKEMAKLRDQVRSIPLDQIKQEIEQSLGKKLDDVFLSLENDPIGTGSIGPVYKGQLKNGDDVVIKVKKPNIDKIITTDISIMLFLVEKMEKVSEDIQFIGLSRVLQDFSAGITSELNFNIERVNCEKFRTNLKKHDTKGIIHIAKIYEQYSSDSVLVMEYLEGPSLNNPSFKENNGNQFNDLFDNGFRIFLKTFLKDGLFHADLHGGNIIYSKEKLGVIDFGLMGHLSRKNRQSLIVIVYAILHSQYDTLVHEFLDVAEYDDIPNVDLLINDVKKAISPIVGLTAQNIDYKSLLKSCVTCLQKHRVYLPNDWFIVFRSLMALDGLGRTLKHDVDIFKFIEEDIGGIILSSFPKEELLKEALWMGRDFLSTTKMLPRHLKWFLKTWSKKGHILEIHHNNLDHHVRSLVDVIRFLGLIFLTGIFTLSGVLFVGERTVEHLNDIPMISWPFWAMAGACLLRAFFLRKIKR